MGLSPQTRAALIRAQEQNRMKLAELQARGALGGPGIPDDASPGEGLLEEYRRTLGIVRWLELKFAEDWTDDLPELVQVVGSEASKVKLETLFGGWWNIYQAERKHLVQTAKLCLDAGIEERQLQLAERSADTMFAIINGVVQRLGLTGEQLAQVPTLVQAVIRETVIPGELV